MSGIAPAERTVPSSEQSAVGSGDARYAVRPRIVQRQAGQLQEAAPQRRAWSASSPIAASLELACSSASFLKLSGATSQSNPHSGAQDLAKAVENLLEYYKTAKAEEEKAVTQLTVKAEITRVSKQ